MGSIAIATGRAVGGREQTDKGRSSISMTRKAGGLGRQRQKKQGEQYSKNSSIQATQQKTAATTEEEV